MTSRKKGFVARAAAIAVATGLVFGASALSANADVGPTQPGAPTEGKLTVYKYKGTQAEANLLDGVEFTVQQVGLPVGEDCVAIDLTTGQGWEAAQAIYTGADGAPEHCLLTGETKETDNGQAVFAGLDLGLYYVTEGDDNGNNNIIAKADPFFVTIPLSQASGGWLYDVVVHPKNSTLGDDPTKTINENQEGLVLGSEVTWTIEATVPTLAATTTFSEASITDPIDPRLSVTDHSVTVGTTGLDRDTHYTLDVSTANLVTIEFLPAGLEVLDANQGATLTVEIVTTVDSLSAGDDDDAGVIHNEADVSFNGQERPTGQPYTYWGGIEILKTDSVDGSLLEGAEFEVYLLAAGGECSVANTAALTPVVFGTTDENGALTFPGLWIANSNVELDDPTRDYCLIETAAPAGYDILTAAQTVIVSTDGDAIVDVDVENQPKEGPGLPVTGSMGTVALTATGLGFLIIGIAVMMVARNRRLGMVA